jgi:glycogen debranching enzyme
MTNKTFFKTILVLLLLAIWQNVLPQELVSSNKKLDTAFKLAVNTIDKNTRDGILAAGADYGGEWTRDISINSWNGVSLLRPETARNSLWSVTVKHDTIGHQYWDKIIWVIGAFNHYKVTGDTSFLREAYYCSKKTIESLEKHYFDKSFGLFAGPSVFNDGIAAYPEPIFDKANLSSSVLDHKNSAAIKCLSTNCIYYGAYNAIVEMGKTLHLKNKLIEEDFIKANELKKNILKHLYDSKRKKFYYLIDHRGIKDSSQEGLGISFAIIFGILNNRDAGILAEKIHISKYGITSVYPDFPRYSREQPGRHNNIVWPMVNGFWAKACKQIGDYKKFTYELMNLADLALDEDKGNNNFREIYNPYSGKPDGGWQSDHVWESCNHQSWSATAFISMITDGVFGLSFDNRGIYLKPYLPDGLNTIEIRDIKYRSAILNINITGSGAHIKSFKVNDKHVKNNFIPAGTKGVQNISIVMKK